MHHRSSAFMVNLLTRWLLLSYVEYPLPCSAENPGASDNDTLAISLCNLAQFVRWPADTAHEKVTICVAGEESAAEALKKIAAAQGPETPPFVIRALENPEQEEGCDILLLHSSRRNHGDEWLAASVGKSVLTASDLPDFLDRGGMIQLEPAEDRVRFSVDLRPVSRSGLSLSSELLKVATSVRGASSDGGTP